MESNYKKDFRGICKGLLVIAAICCLVRNAEAQDSKGKKKDTGVKVETRDSGRKVYRITTGFVIEGRIQKPNAFYVLQRSQINYDWAKLNKDFVPAILESVTHKPF